MANPFIFSARLHFSELTGLRAQDLSELLAGLKTVPDSSIYHHTHRFLQQHLSASPEPPNDFSYWASRILGDEELGEVLASIDIMQFTDIPQLRQAIIEAVESYTIGNPQALRRFCGKGKEFYFIKAVSFVIPAGETASDLTGFVQALKKISVDSIYFHTFEARLRLGKRSNDFSCWIETVPGCEDLAAKIARLDPYTHTIDDLRANIIKLVERKLKAGSHG